MRPVSTVSARGRKPWLAAHWSIVWVCIGSDFPGHEIRSWVILKMSCYFKLFFNFMFDMSSHIYLGKLCFARTPTVQPLPHSWCWGRGRFWLRAGTAVGTIALQGIVLRYQHNFVWILEREMLIYGGDEYAFFHLKTTSLNRSKIKQPASAYQSKK